MNSRRIKLKCAYRLYTMTRMVSSLTAPTTSRVIFEMVLNRRPVSVNAKGKGKKRWQTFVSQEAAKYWTIPPLTNQLYYFQVIYICDEIPVDTDNIIKPIQDALNKLVYDDDVNIIDVSAHRRYVSDSVPVDQLPDLLKNSILSQNTLTDTVYIKICSEREIGDFR